MRPHFDVLLKQLSSGDVGKDFGAAAAERVMDLGDVERVAVEGVGELGEEQAHVDGV